MADSKIFVDLQRCTGCWTCSMACKVGNDLPDGDFRQTIRTLGSGEGIDRPAGTWPDLHESWIPIWSKACTKCPERIKDGAEPYCVYNCPNGALSFGEQANAKMDEFRAKGFRIWQLPSWENSKDGIFYASK